MVEAIEDILRGAFNFEFGPVRQFHTMKHFSSIDEDFVKKYLHQYRGFSRIEERLQKNVSKFIPEFANNPFSVIAMIRKFELYYIRFARSRGERLEIQLSFHKNYFPPGIGYNSLLKIAELEKDQQKLVFEEDGLKYISTDGIENLSWHLNLILEKIESGFEVITFFPGIFAPPLPDESDQSRAYFEDNQKFWNEHAILRNSIES